MSDDFSRSAISLLVLALLDGCRMQSSKVLYEMDFLVSADRKLLGVVLPTAEVQLGWRSTTPAEGARIRKAVLPANSK